MGTAYSSTLILAFDQILGVRQMKPIPFISTSDNSQQSTPMSHPTILYLNAKVRPLCAGHEEGKPYRDH